MRNRMLALMLLALSQAAGAFPIPYAATVSVSPWVPTPQQTVSIAVSDTYTGFLQPGPDFANVIATVTGNSIAVTATFAPAGAVGIASRTVDVGPLAPGRYTVTYASDSQLNSSMHRASMSFSVVEEGLSTAVEFYSTARDHYFITADTAEIALLDQGVMPGWTRTGESFKVMFGEAMQSTAKSVCRFYGLPSAGLDSHFFAASFSECIDVINRWPTQWQLETTNAFGVVAEAPVIGCVGASQPLYRLYNNRPDANHRYTTSRATRDAMTAKGWIPEGSAMLATPDEIVAMCVPM